MLVFHRCWKTKVSPAEVQHPLHANGVALQVDSRSSDGGMEVNEVMSTQAMDMLAD